MKNNTRNNSESEMAIDGIPEELKRKPNFLLHRKKRPVDEGGKALSGWPNKGRPFEEVRQLLANELTKPLSKRKFDGIGYMPKGDGLMCIDLDKARDPDGNITPQVDELIRDIQSNGGWIEESQSGNVHVWTRGTWPRDKSSKHSIDVFHRSGYVCLTGKPLAGYEQGGIPESDNPLLAVRARVLGSRTESVGNSDFESFADNQKLDPDKWTLERVEEEVINKLPIPFDYDIWKTVAYGLNHQFGDDAFDLFDSYSQKCPEKYDAAGVRVLWNSIKNKWGKRLITLRSLIKMAGLDRGELFGESELDAWFPAISIKEAVPRAISFVIDGFIGEGIFVIAGSPGCGKSSLIFNLLLKAAHLCPPNDPLKPAFRRHVVYITEDPRQASDMLYAVRQWGDVSQSDDEIQEWLTIREGRRTDHEKLGDIVQLISKRKTV